jgi:hypothetical protein
LMAHQSEPSSGPVMIAGRCSFFPSASAIPCNPSAGLPTVTRRVFAALIAHPTLPLQAQSLYRTSFSRTKQKRGPPSLA